METVLAFRVGDAYLFDRYFEREYLFEALAEYYDEEEYRFEVPVEEFEAIEEQLAAAGIDLLQVEDPEPYCVVTGKYDKHADILGDAVASWTRRGHRFFLLGTDRAVAAALDDGAKRVSETEFVAGL